MESLTQTSSLCPSTSTPHFPPHPASAPLSQHNPLQLGDRGSETPGTEWVLQNWNRMIAESTKSLPILRFVRERRHNAYESAVQKMNCLAKNSQAANGDRGRDIMTEVSAAQRMSHSSNLESPTPTQSTSVLKPEPIEETLVDAGSADKNHFRFDSHSVWSPIMQKKKEECLRVIPIKEGGTMGRRSNERHKLVLPSESRSLRKLECQRGDLIDSEHCKRVGTGAPDARLCHPKTLPFGSNFMKRGTGCEQKGDPRQPPPNPLSASWSIPSRGFKRESTASSKAELSEHINSTCQGMNAFMFDMDSGRSKLSRKEALRTHKGVAKGNMVILQCDVAGCGKLLTGKYARSNLARHKEALHESNPPVQCDERGCGRVLKCMKTYRVHQRTVHGHHTGFKCDFPGCGRILKTSRYYANHKDTVHGKCTPVTCDFPGCKTVLKTWRYYINHKDTVHGKITPVQCDFPGCGIILKNSRYYARHKVTVHGKITPVQCDFPGCGRILKSSRYYANHKKTVHGSPKPVQCEIAGCGKVLRCYRYYVRHKREVHGVRHVSA